MSRSRINFYYEIDKHSPTSPLEFVDEISHAHALLKSFVHTFSNSDTCILTIAVPDISFPAFSLEELVTSWLDEMSFWRERPTNIVVQAPGEASTCDSFENIVLDSSSPISGDVLFRLYRSKSTELLGTYDYDIATNQYDPLYIPIIKTSGDAKFGSTEPSNFTKQLQYIFDPENRVRSVLDAGCGAGFFLDMLEKTAYILQQQGPLYVGVDAARSQVFRAQKRFPKSFFRIGDVCHLDFPDDSFDLVNAYSVLPFISGENGIQAIKEILRISRLGAFFQLTCTSADMLLTSNGSYTRPILEHEEETTIYMYDLTEVTEVLDKCDHVTWTTKNVILARTEFGMVTYQEGEEKYANAYAQVEFLYAQQERDLGSEGPVLNSDIGANLWQGVVVDVAPAGYQDADDIVSVEILADPLFYSRHLSVVDDRG